MGLESHRFGYGGFGFCEFFTLCSIFKKNTLKCLHYIRTYDSRRMIYCFILYQMLSGLYPNRMDAQLCQQLYYILNHLLYYLYHWSYYWPASRFRAASTARKRGDKCCTCTLGVHSFLYLYISFHFNTYFLFIYICIYILIYNCFDWVKR